MTVASREVQHKKLKAPFRSPLVNIAAVHEGVEGVYSSGKSPSKLPVFTKSQTEPDENDSDVKLDSAKARKARVSKQFKSPISSGQESAQSGLATSSVTGAPLIQKLQAQVQTLKQAIKIKQSSDEDQLERLAKKWKTAGREIAWAVWDTVKDADPSVDLGPGSVKGGWGEDDERQGDAKAGGSFQSGWGWGEGKNGDTTMPDARGEAQEDTEDEEKPQHTLGTMLRYMGIAPETMGWDEGEGDFVDA